MRPWSLPGTNRLRFALHGGQRELGINPNTLHTWISKYSKPSQSRPVVKRTDEHLYDELKRL
ncbi:hypothetical protein, partial [Thiolapillus sp.]|uniref:hypothetical protein n=1 Tax=Thiolapillus sp. TaxID=2017437 RepID=UPI003AF5B94F